MKVLVTGANGFLGSWLTKRLLAEGHQVNALIRKNSDLSELENTKPNYIYGDVTDALSLQEACKNMDTVFHLAGVVAYKKSERPTMDKVNVQGTANVIAACETLKVPQLLHLSSVVAIGAMTKPQVMTEQMPYNIGHLNLGYFETKHQAELLVRTAAQENRIHAICVNPSTIYGFGDAKKGSRKTQVKVAQGRFPFYTSGGVNVVAVEDVIEGILLALKNGKNGERYILSSENMSIKDLFTKIAGFAGVPAPKIQIPNWALHGLGMLGDVSEKAGISLGLSRENAYTATLFHWFDCKKAKEELGFTPTSSDRAIENSVKWMKDHKYI
ncbi:MAG: dihydroflavonol 4-reductase [Bdellovibrionales bacterium RIFCSPHIGHO2_01_FULL_40_29]|nr:MAG: dihydroflavonol 4-reductase [Bdellovibrionales bacterium RIFCSPHIGHO2_01_FULL_40_29]OFZ35041.1 MAG: dihydroflavonol 4-reductase [Bdellovibrionales bacterium RIFCSPHIGHO2_02_FULL_40_15]